MASILPTQTPSPSELRAGHKRLERPAVARVPGPARIVADFVAAPHEFGKRAIARCGRLLRLDACSQSPAKHQRWPIDGWRLLVGELAGCVRA